MKITVELNKKKTTLSFTANQTLNSVLIELGLLSVKKGCEEGNCGSCTIIVNDRAVQSCMMLAAQVEGKSIQTFESIEKSSKHQPVYNALLDNTDRDCGFCIPGMMMSLEALLKTGRFPDEDEVNDVLNGNACHCRKNAKDANSVLAAIKKFKGDY